MSSLLNIHPDYRYHLYRKETDMRKSFNSLSGIVVNELGKRIKDGDVFIFINRPRTHIKILRWENNGFTLFYRKLDKGAFELPVFNHDDSSMPITSDQLHFIIKGISLKGVKYRKIYQQSRQYC